MAKGPLRTSVKMGFVVRQLEVIIALSEATSFGGLAGHIAEALEDLQKVRKAMK